LTIFKFVSFGRHNDQATQLLTGEELQVLAFLGGVLVGVAQEDAVPVTVGGVLHALSDGCVKWIEDVCDDQSECF
jgi:hypothetical protein